MPEHSNGWNKYEVHVLESLNRLEQGLKDVQAAVKDLAEKDTKEFGLLKSEVNAVKRDYKWHVKIASAFWAAIIVIINFAISYFKG